MSTLNIRIPINVDYDQLNNASRPTNPNLPEAVPWVLYDTQSYAAAGQTVISYFDATNADKTLSNMDAAGQLTYPNYFAIHRVMIDWLQTLTAGGAAEAGALDDIAKAFLTGRGTFTLTLASKNYGPWPITFTGKSGGPSSVALSQAGDAAANHHQYANSPDNGGYPLNGSLVIPPNQKFGVTLNWNAAVAISALTNVRVALFGILYRRIA